MGITPGEKVTFTVIPFGEDDRRHKQHEYCRDQEKVRNLVVFEGSDRVRVVYRACWRLAAHYFQKEPVPADPSFPAVHSQSPNPNILTTALSDRIYIWSLREKDSIVISASVC